MSKTRKVRKARQALQKEKSLVTSLEQKVAYMNRGMNLLEQSLTFAQVTVNSILNTIVEVLPKEDMVSYLAGRRQVVIAQSPFESVRVLVPHPTREVLTVEDVYPLLVHYAAHVEKYPHVVVSLEYKDNTACYGLNLKAFENIPTEVLARQVASELVKHLRREGK